MIKKITQKDRDNLISARIKKIDEDKFYGLELFELYYKDPAKENIRVWSSLGLVAKEKIVKQIIKWEDSAILKMAVSMHKINIKKQLEYVNLFKLNQLEEFGIIKDGTQ